MKYSSPTWYIWKKCPLAIKTKARWSMDPVSEVTDCRICIVPFQSLTQHSCSVRTRKKADKASLDDCFHDSSWAGIKFHSQQLCYIFWFSPSGRACVWKKG